MCACMHVQRDRQHRRGKLQRPCPRHGGPASAIAHESFSVDGNTACEQCAPATVEVHNTWLQRRLSRSGHVTVVMVAQAAMTARNHLGDDAFGRNQALLSAAA